MSSRFFPSFLFSILCFSIFSLCLIPFSYARQEIDSSEKLALLNNLINNTHKPVADFQERVDAVMKTDPTLTYAYIGTQDQEAREKALEDQKQKTAELAVVNEKAAKNSAGLKEKTSLSGVTNPEDQPLKTRDDASEQNFQERKIKLDEETADRARQEGEKTAAAVKPKTENTENAEKSGLAPSLANNPFYFKAAPEEQKKFDGDRNVIIGRLVNQMKFKDEEAEELVRQASSPEELIILLMKERQYTYQEAEDIVQTS